MRFETVLLLTSIGIDSVSAARFFIEEEQGIEYSCAYLVFNKTPLTHPKYLELLELLSQRLGVRYFITEPTGYAYRPPTCRNAWKINPLKHLIERFCKPVLLVTGQKRIDSPVRSKLGKFGKWFVNGVYVYRPIYEWISTWNYAVEILPEAKTVWKEIKSKHGHTSLDCVPCLRKVAER